MTSVLICEDNSRLASEWTKALREFGCEVTSTYSLNEALAHISEFDYDLFIIDIFFMSYNKRSSIQKADGIKLISKIGTLRQKRDKKIIAVSGASYVGEPGIRLTTLKNLGVDTFLEKPFSIEELLEEVYKYRQETKD